MLAVAVANFSSLVLATGASGTAPGLFSSLRMVCRSEIALLSWPMPVDLVVSLSRRLSCASFGAFSAATRVETMFLISRPEL